MITKIGYGARPSCARMLPLPRLKIDRAITLGADRAGADQDRIGEGSLQRNTDDHSAVLMCPDRPSGP